MMSRCTVRTDMISIETSETHPEIRIDGPVEERDVQRYIAGITRPEKHADEGVCTLHRVPATSDRVESRPIAIRRRRVNATSFVAISIHVAVSQEGCSCHNTVGRHATIGACVDSDLIRLYIIDAFDPA